MGKRIIYPLVNKSFERETNREKDRKDRDGGHPLLYLKYLFFPISQIERERKTNKRVEKILVIDYMFYLCLPSQV